METTTTNSPFADALRADMEALHINPRQTGLFLRINTTKRLRVVNLWVYSLQPTTRWFIFNKKGKSNES